ncbi:MAG: hypothetical protein BJ554DRAFT_329 [Olpidium bornovanus]|uniref:Uncharacterized protein n=1 Tax=Olpidium bornovanus TaxID=278681 RepID=A0A8H7ZTQ2_9FUNG|nr:MAG: hypothetical protein BJ554DRAFT_329 [Olpidium bornovanus]
MRGGPTRPSPGPPPFTRGKRVSRPPTRAPKSGHSAASSGHDRARWAYAWSPSRPANNTSSAPGAVTLSKRASKA